MFYLDASLLICLLMTSLLLSLLFFSCSFYSW